MHVKPTLMHDKGSLKPLHHNHRKHILDSLDIRLDMSALQQDCRYRQQRLCETPTPLSVVATTRAGCTCDGNTWHDGCEAGSALACGHTQREPCIARCHTQMCDVCVCANTRVADWEHHLCTHSEKPDVMKTFSKNA